ncbi:MAG: PqqD family protein [Pseudonocardiaceae bacterium]
MTDIKSRSVRLRSSGLSSRKVGEELVVLDFVSSQYFTIRGSGIFLFDLLQEKRDRDELVAAVLARFDVEEDTARRDVDTFLSELSGAGLLST